MTIGFTNIPSNLRTSLFYAEFDNSKAGSAVAGTYPALLIGGRVAAGTVAAGVLTKVTSESQAVTYFGAGSILADMFKGFFANNRFKEVWGLALDDDGAGVAHTKTVTVTGTATADGVIYLYVHGRLVPIVVSSGDVQNDIAAAIDAALTADTANLLMSNSVATNVVTLTAKNDGPTGDQIDVRTNYLGLAGGEADVAGVTVAIADGVAGANPPDVSGVTAILGDQRFDYICHPYADSASIDDFDTMMDDSTGRFAWNRQVYGHVFTAYRDTASALGTAYGYPARNGHHHTVIGLDPTPTNPWFLASEVVALASASLDNDPVLQLTTLELAESLVPEVGAEFTQTERNTLLYDGVSTLYADGTYRIEALITNYQVDGFGSEDDSYLHVTTLFTLMRISRELATMTTSQFGRVKLVDDETPVGPGQPVVTPALYEGALIDKYAEMATRGWVENTALFAANLIVERNDDNPNRLDVLFPPDLANQLRQLAMLIQFRLQYPTALA